MLFSQIHHCALVVTDLERAVGFYSAVLGLQEIQIPATFPSAGLNVRWFQVGAQQIHLTPGTGMLPSQSHLALQVDNARAARSLLRKKGIEILEETPVPSADRFVIMDSEGNRIEIIEWKRE